MHSRKKVRKDVKSILSYKCQLNRENIRQSMLVQMSFWSNSEHCPQSSQLCPLGSRETSWKYFTGEKNVSDGISLWTQQSWFPSLRARVTESPSSGRKLSVSQWRTHRESVTSQASFDGLCERRPSHICSIASYDRKGVWGSHMN